MQLATHAEFDHDLTFWNDMTSSLDLSPISDTTSPVFGATPPCLMESLGMPELRMDTSADEEASSLLNIAEEIGGLFNEDLTTGARDLFNFNSPLNTPDCDVTGELQLCARAPVSVSAASAETNKTLQAVADLDIDELLRSVNDDVISQFPVSPPNTCMRVEEINYSEALMATSDDDSNARLPSLSEEDVRLSFDDVTVVDEMSPSSDAIADVDYFEVFKDLSKEIEQEFGFNFESNISNAPLTDDVTPPPNSTSVTSPFSTIELSGLTDLLDSPLVPQESAPASVTTRKRGYCDVSETAIDSVRADHDYVSRDALSHPRTKKRRVSVGRGEPVCVEVAEDCEALVQSNNITSNVEQQDHIFKKPLPVVASTQALKSTRAPSTEPSTYREKRDKNNVASQRSRRMRKEKFLEMDEQVVALETQNQAMREKIVKMEALAKAMREALVSKISGK